MQDTVNAFLKKYDQKNLRKVKSPLRICPLGAHVDHQGGVVTGIALDSSVNMVYIVNIVNLCILILCIQLFYKAPFNFSIGYE